MTNEELVKAIQTGHKEYIEPLWLQVRKFISVKAYDYITAKGGEKYDLIEDMVNESYFTFIRAIEKYDETRGAKFLSYLGLWLNNSFADVYFGGRTEKHMKEPLNNYHSIDMPLSEDTNETIADLIEDLGAIAEIEAVEDKLFMQGIRKLLEDCLNDIDDRMGAEIIYQMLSQNLKFGEVVKRSANDPSQKEYKKKHRHYMRALAQLKKKLSSSATRTQMERLGFYDYISYNFTGVSSFNHMGFTSVVEHNAFKRLL